MVLVNFVTFVVLNILDNLFSMQNSLNANNCWQKQNFENCPTQKLSNTHVVRVTLVSHLCHSCSTRVANVLLVSHSCCSCHTRIELLPLAPGAHVVQKTRSRLLGHKYRLTAWILINWINPFFKLLKRASCKIFTLFFSGNS